MDGVTWRGDNPDFAEVTPPRAFGCRCSVVSYSQADVDEEAIVIATHIPAGFSVQPGYGIEGINRVLREAAEREPRT